MAIKFPNLNFLKNADAKTRIFLLFAAIAVVVLIIFFLVRYFTGGGRATGTQVAAAPVGLQTVPGSQMTPEFYRAVVQANQQAAQQAQISGTSAVPTLINPGQQAFPQQPCTIVCPSDETANVADDINALLKQGKISAAVAKILTDLAKGNSSLCQYAIELDKLACEAKLSPDQARVLLERYKKQYSNNLLKESGAMMDGMIKNCKLPVEIASDLLALQKRGASPAEYAAELNRRVRDGKLTPALAAQLLAQFTQQQQAELAKEGKCILQQMAAAGEITPDVANALAALQDKGVSCDDYAAELNRLVGAGKMTPAAAAKLKDQYCKQRASLGPTQTLNAMLDKEHAKIAAMINDLVKSGKLTADEGARLSELIKCGKTLQDVQAALTPLVKPGKLTAAVAELLMKEAKKYFDMCAMAQRLATLQGNNASLEDYAAELKRDVADGLLTPEEAAALLQQYQAFKTPITPAAGVAPGVEANLPGVADFARLQKAVQAGGAPAPVTAEQFNVPPTPPAPTPTTTVVTEAGPTAEERQARIAALQAAMSGQAQNLINAWQPAVMSHREGTFAEEKAKAEAAAAGGGAGGAGAETTVTTTGPAARPIVKAGTIAFAILDTAVNSDYPDTPVMATIISGPFKGAKLLGKLSLAQNGDRVSLIFNLMNRDDWPMARQVNAFAIDPDTARTVMASCVDYHYLKKYGAIMATAFAQGFAEAISQSGSTTTNGIFGPTTTHPVLSFGNKLAVGLGQVGTTIGSTFASKWANMPTTVKVCPGVSLGILFMSDVPAIPQENVIVNTNPQQNVVVTPTPQQNVVVNPTSAPTVIPVPAPAPAPIPAPVAVVPSVPVVTPTTSGQLLVSTK